MKMCDESFVQRGVSWLLHLGTCAQLCVDVAVVRARGASARLTAHARLVIAVPTSRSAKGREVSYRGAAKSVGPGHARLELAAHLRTGLFATPA